MWAFVDVLLTLSPARRPFSTESLPGGGWGRETWEKYVGSRSQTGQRPAGSNAEKAENEGGTERSL